MSRQILIIDLCLKYQTKQWPIYHNERFYSFTFISHVQDPLTLIKKNPKGFFREKRDFLLWYMFKPIQSINCHLHTHGFFSCFQVDAVLAVNICRHWFTAVSLTCLSTFCGISSSLLLSVITSNNSSLYDD